MLCVPGPARFAVPAKSIDTQELFTGEDGAEGSDDEEALKLSYDSIMRRLKGSADNAHVYHTGFFRPQYYANDRPPTAPQQLHDHEYQQQAYTNTKYDKI